MTRYDLIQAYGSEEALDEAQKRSNEIFRSYHSKVGVSKETLSKENETKEEDNMNTSERILQLEKELTDLRAQERKEKEEAEKKAKEDRDKELTSIRNAIIAFNEKYNEHICLAEEINIESGKNIWNIFSPWLRGTI